MLVNNGMQAKLIQSNEGFNLYNLFEIRYFINELNLDGDTYTIGGDIWENAKGSYLTGLQHHSRYVRDIKDFETLTHTKTKYRSDRNAYTGIKHGISDRRKQSFLSTMHKARV